MVELNKKYELEKINFLDQISRQKTENSSLVRTLAASNKDLTLLKSQLEKTQQSLVFH